MAIKTLEDLFVHSISDIYNAEKQLTKALPKMARAATDPALVRCFESHLEETVQQVDRIEQAMDACGLSLKRVKCAAMEGLIEEGKEVIEEIAAGPVLDAGLIGAAQKVEHYEIATYGTLLALAQQLGYDEVTTLLTQTLQEEKGADEKLNKIALQGINKKAERKAA